MPAGSLDRVEEAVVEGEGVAARRHPGRAHAMEPQPLLGAERAEAEHPERPELALEDWWGHVQPLLSRLVVAGDPVVAEGHVGAPGEPAPLGGAGLELDAGPEILARIVEGANAAARRLLDAARQRTGIDYTRQT